MKHRLSPRKLAMSMGLAALVLAPISASAQSPRAQANRKPAAAPVNQEIKDFSISDVRGNRFDLRVALFKPGGRSNEQIKVLFVEGNQKHVLHQGNAGFAGTRDGFSNAITVDLSGRPIQRGHLELHIVSCQEHAKCKRSVRLNKGDLKMDGPPQTERAGSDSIVRFNLKNNGPGPMASCKVVLEVEGRKVKEFPVANMAANASQRLEFRYKQDQKNKPFSARIDCDDLAKGNNSQTGRLR